MYLALKCARLSRKGSFILDMRLSIEESDILCTFSVGPGKESGHKDFVVSAAYNCRTYSNREDTTPNSTTLREPKKSLAFYESIFSRLAIGISLYGKGPKCFAR